MASDEEKKLDASLVAELKSGAGQIMATLALRLLIAELASKGRTPEEAQSFIDKMRSSMESFVDLSDTKDGQFTKVITDEMRSYVNRLFSGIGFVRK